MGESNRMLTVHWKDHGKQLSQGLWDFFIKECLVDTKVSFYGDFVQVHRILLAIFLPAFSKMKTDNSVEEVNLNYVANHMEDVQSLVEFVYTGRTTIAADRIEYVRRLAHHLGFEDFSSLIEQCQQNDDSFTVGEVEKDESFFSSKQKRNSTSTTTVSVTKEQSSSSKLTVPLVSRIKNENVALECKEKTTNDQSEKPNETEDDEVTAEEVSDDEIVKSKDDKKRNYRRKRLVSMKCGNCNYQTPDMSSFRRHIKQQHAAENLKCDKCNKEFKSQSPFWFHKSTSCGQDLQYVCSYCGHRTLRRTTWQQHLAAKHKVDTKGNPLEENVKCTKCDFVCFARHQLKDHVLRKHLEKKYDCPECEYAAISSSKLKKHISIRHLKERKYVCEVCGVSYQTSGALNVHIRTRHKGEKRFKCPECGKEYNCKKSYQIHMSKHTGNVQLFVCHLCGHSCNRRYNLGTHMRRIHSVKIERLKKDYAPRQTTNEAEDASDNLEIVEEDIFNGLQEIDDS